MSISKHGKIFWLDIRVKNKRIRRSLKTESRNEALARYAPLREKLLEKHLGEKVRFSEFCQKYLDWAWSSKPASSPREQQRLKIIQSILKEVVYLDDITPYHIEGLKAELKSRRLSKATINRYLQILRGLFYKAIDWEVYKKGNPLKKIRFFKESPQVEVLNSRQVEKVLLEASRIACDARSPLQKVFHDLVLLALNTGMRKSEILNLKWRDIKGDFIRVRGKGDKVRDVPMNEMAREIIFNQQRRDEYVFRIPNRHQSDLFRRTVLQIRKRTGINFNFHQLRHYFTTSLLEKGIDFVTIGSLLGHSNRMTTLLYSHTNGEKKKKAVDLLGAK